MKFGRFLDLEILSRVVAVACGIIVLLVILLVFQEPSSQLNFQPDQLANIPVIVRIVGALVVLFALFGVMFARSARVLTEIETHLRGMGTKLDGIEQAVLKCSVASAAKMPIPSINSRTLRLSGTGEFSDYELQVTAEEVARNAITIGRETGVVAFPIHDERISRLHAKLQMGGTDFRIESFATANGTQLNGRDLTLGELATLHSGDILKLGPAIFRISIS